MRTRTGIAAVVGVVLAGVALVPATAHERDLMTVGGRVGPIKTGETTVGEMRKHFGDVKKRDVIRVGCSKVIRLRWGGIHTLHYPRTNVIVDVRVQSETVPSSHGTYRFHTRDGLRVGDSERKLRRLYPKSDGYRHSGHTHYILGERWTRLLAKVVDGTVIELEAAPYEFC